MASVLKPIYLLADSQLLFWMKEGELFLDAIKQNIMSAAPKAAYIGASNRDNPDFYLIFKAAMNGIGIDNCRMILSTCPEESRAYLAEADIILLGGGDVERGWKTFQQNGLSELIVSRYFAGALLIGVSAGAVQLGWCGWGDGESSHAHLIDTFKLVTAIVSAHEEKEDWRGLKKAMQAVDNNLRGIGIPTGGGMIYHEDQSIEPIRYPLVEFSIKENLIVQSLLIPSNGVAIQESEKVC